MFAKYTRIKKNNSIRWNSIYLLQKKYYSKESKITDARKKYFLEASISRKAEKMEPLSRFFVTGRIKKEQNIVWRGLTLKSENKQSWYVWVKDVIMLSEIYLVPFFEIILCEHTRAYNFFLFKFSQHPLIFSGKIRYLLYFNFQSWLQTKTSFHEQSNTLR